MTPTYDRLHLAAGTELFAEGDAATSAYVIESGEIEIWVSRARKRVPIARRGVGDMVGEMAIADASARSASATVISDCVLFEVSASQFQHRTAAMDPVMRTCLSIMLDRFRSTMSLIDQAAAGPDSSARQDTREPGSRIPLDRLVLEREIERAIADHSLELHYQPIVALPTRRIAGYEALTRWRHPERGYIPPGEFIAVAEQTGAIGNLTRWVARTAISDIAALAAHHAPGGSEHPAPFVSINISASNLGEPVFAEEIGAMLQRLGRDDATIKIEITESALMDNPERAIDSLNDFRRRGFALALDDFGTGYSSLAYLARLPLTALKIDRSFVSAIDRDPAKYKIARMIIMLARELGLSTIAEGIETAGQEQCLLDLGCDFGQGFLYSPAKKVRDIAETVRQWEMGERKSARASR